MSKFIEVENIETTLKFLNKAISDESYTGAGIEYNIKIGENGGVYRVSSMGTLLDKEVLIKMRSILFDTIETKSYLMTAEIDDLQQAVDKLCVLVKKRLISTAC